MKQKPCGRSALTATDLIVSILGRLVVVTLFVLDKLRLLR